MAVSKAQKVEILGTLENHLKEAVSVGFTSNTKLTALDVSTMKKELRAANTVFMLAKKTLIKIAFKNVLNVEINLDELPGQVAIIISKGDKVAGLAIVNKYANEWKKEEKMKFVAGYFDGTWLDAKAIARIAGLPSREVLLAKLLGSMMSPLSGLARFFDAAGKEMTLKGATKVGDIASATPAPAATPVVEASKTEEAPAPVVEEAPVAEVVAEEVPAAVAEEAPATTEEAAA